MPVAATSHSLEGLAALEPRTAKQDLRKILAADRTEEQTRLPRCHYNLVDLVSDVDDVEAYGERARPSEPKLVTDTKVDLGVARRVIAIWDR